MIYKCGVSHSLVYPLVGRVLLLLMLLLFVAICMVSNRLYGMCKY